MFEISSEFLMYFLIGFAAQIVDGSLGMAYGTLSASILLSTGLPPVTVSASVHTAQIATTGLSALSHTLFKNVNWKLFILLACFGSIGGAAGAMFLTKVEGAAIKPWIVAYLFGLGLYILYKLWCQHTNRTNGLITHPGKIYNSMLGFLGGMLDSIGGGGWGPVVTSNLIAKGENPRLVIGTVNTAECVVKTCISLTFIVTVGFVFTDVVMGLLLGGVLAAPLGAYVLRLIPARYLMALVGCLITGLSGWQFYQLVM